MAAPRICSVENCCKIVWRRSYCSGHYQRMMKYGDPLAGGTSKGVCIQWLRDHVTHEGDDCLIWPFGTFSNGYARVYDPSNRSEHSAPNVMCREVHGDPPSETHEARHLCGKGHEGCIHPKHLIWGTKSENSADRIEHGTANRGIRHGHSKLTDDDVRAIRRMAQTKPQREVGRLFGVTQAAVSDIVTGRNWGWLAD